MNSNPPSHRERLVAPGLWWGAVAFVALTIGWILLVATTPAKAGAAALVTALIAGAGLWHWGSLQITAGPGHLRAGDAHLETPDLGTVVALDPAAWREAVSRAGTDRAFLLTRPWIDRGVRVEVADPTDPTPYWLVSTRRPDALTRAVGQTGPAPEAGDSPNERISDGPQAREDGDA